ncbi:hypothetical protein [Lysobacter capsici]|uniref:hypothetical protein n=1 Tax=Lysobacter capsici TaxID=435897 RepID=UPI001C001F82|nr:hypothetical protein [Lysobacter capsici]MBW8808218.1 hypothetical protein [Lysobacter sp.]QWF17170.1 hypothetical protein KME82_26175 [Lysobacter capsici]
MRITRHKTLFAAAFVFATAFASTASASFDWRCESCMSTYDYCASQPDASIDACVTEYNICAGRYNCPYMPI